MNNIANRVLPHSMESEQALLGGIFISYDKYIHRLVVGLPADAFYREAHELIYQGILDLYNDDIEINPVTVGEHLKIQGSIDKVGGIEYLFSLLEGTSTSTGWEYHMRIVLDCYRKRKTIYICQEVVESLFELNSSNTQALKKLDKHITENYTANKNTSLKKLEESVTETFKELEKLAEQDSFITGLDTGYHELNRYTAGLQASDLVIIAARPGMGKTALALNIAHNVSKKGKVAAVFSLEMSDRQLVGRLLSLDSHIDSKKIKTGQLRDSDWTSLTHSSGNLMSLPIYIDDSFDNNIIEMRSKLKYLLKYSQLDLVIIDYLQLMRGSKSESRQLEISDYSRALKGLAKDFKVPVVCLSQLNRKVEERSNKRPLLSDLRESGSIEQDADLVLFIYRDELYNKSTDSNRNVAEIIIAKQRNGDTGSFYMTFRKEYTQFLDYAEEQENWYQKY